MQKVIGIFSDTHGNLPALKAIVEKFRELKCDEIIHTGDVISMGPFSPECLDYLFNSEVVMINGNHDINYINNDTVPPNLSHVPAEHKEFIFNQVGEGYRNKMRMLPLIVYRNFYGTRFAFMHYALAKQKLYKQFTFEPINPNPDAQFFDYAFDGLNAEVVFFGHKHEITEIKSKKHYIDVGSVGCYELPYARGIVLRVEEDGSYDFERLNVPYDRQSVYEAMKSRNMPCYQHIWDFYFRDNLAKYNLK